MDELAILVVRPGTLTGVAKKQLKQSGVVIIETDDPDSVKLMKPNAELSGSELLYAALVGIDGGGLEPHKTMVRTMRRIMARKMNEAETAKS